MFNSQQRNIITDDLELSTENYTFEKDLDEEMKTPTLI